jgi:hypothetical protein
MLGLLFYFLFGYLVIQYSKPVHFAAGYAVCAGLLSLIVGESLFSVLISGAILFAYTAFVYMVVERYSDSILAPIGALIGGAMILVAAAFMGR